MFVGTTDAIHIALIRDELTCPRLSGDDERLQIKRLMAQFARGRLGTSR